MIPNPDEAIDAVLGLPAELRMELARRLVRSVVDDGETADSLLTDEQAAEVHRRLEELKADPSCGLSHEEVWSRLRRNQE